MDEESGRGCSKRAVLQALSTQPSRLTSIILAEDVGKYSAVLTVCHSTTFLFLELGSESIHSLFSFVCVFVCVCKYEENDIDIYYNIMFNIIDR